MSARAILLLFVSALALSGCDSPDSTLKKLEKQISAYSVNSSEEDLDSIQQGFARLDSEIENLEAHGKTAKARELSREKTALQEQFTSARLAVGLTKVQSAVRGIGDAVKQVGQEMEQALQPEKTPKNHSGD
jgi:uncharacterized protein YlxW (UPF0749 family)